jgi:hypothetical protein
MGEGLFEEFEQDLQALSGAQIAVEGTVRLRLLAVTAKNFGDPLHKGIMQKSCG